MSVEAYPLHWPDNWPRTPLNQIGWSRFDTSMSVARDSLLQEIRLLGGSYVVLSTNVRLRQDNLPYANDKEPSDAGVAVYFKYKGQPMCFACDKYYYVRENIQAIRKTIEALRGIERWGASDMMQRAFSGFAQLPSPDQVKARNWRAVLDVDASVTDLEYVEYRYKQLRGIRHPDKGGTTELWDELQTAIEQARSELA